MVAKKKVLIFGSTGRLGKRFVEHFKNIDFAYEFLTPVRQEVDLLVPFKVALDRFAKNCLFSPT